MSGFFESGRDADTRTRFDILWNNNRGPHFHSNIEMIYVAEGTIDMTINGTVHRLEKDDFMIIEPYKIHTYSSPSPSTLYFAITPARHYKELINPPTHCLQQYIYPKGRYSQDIKQCFLKVRECVHADQQMTARGYIWAIISYLIYEYGRKDTSSNTNSDLFVSLLQYLQQHYCEKITLDDLSARFGYNKYYISKMFNRYVNLNFSDFVNSMRCHHALEMLTNKEIAITEIAEKSGFESLRSFHRAFQKFFNCTPTEYRKKVSNNSQSDKATNLK